MQNQKKMIEALEKLEDIHRELTTSYYEAIDRHRRAMFEDEGYSQGRVDAQQAKVREAARLARVQADLLEQLVVAMDE